MKPIHPIYKLSLSLMIVSFACVTFSQTLFKIEKGPTNFKILSDPSKTQELHAAGVTEIKEGEKVKITRLWIISYCEVSLDAKQKMEDPNARYKPLTYCTQSPYLATTYGLADDSRSNQSIFNSVCKIAFGNDFSGTAKGRVDRDGSRLHNASIYTSVSASEDSGSEMKVVNLGLNQFANYIHYVDCIHPN